jgi:ribosomal protein S18 acetylase RimI-like enzyme
LESIDIRSCRHDDIDAVLTLDRAWEREAVAQIFVPISRDEFLASLAQFPAYFLVAERNHRIIGYINGTIQLATEVTIIPAHERYLQIENLYVTAEFRHQQIGGHLMERLLDTAQQQGIQHVLVSSNSKQIEKILAFYQGYGFKLWHVQLYK